MIDSEVTYIAYRGDGRTDRRWNIPFVFNHHEDLAVYIRIVATGEVTPEVLGSDYTIEGGDLGRGPPETGTLVYGSVILNNRELWIFRRPEPKQGVDYNQFTVIERTHEEAFDQLAIHQQALEAQIRDTIRIAITDKHDGSGGGQRIPVPVLPTVENRKDQYFVFDANGDPDATTEPATTTIAAPIDAFSDAASLNIAANEILIPGRNFAINGAFEINQRQPSTVQDKRYFVDQWLSLLQIGAFAITAEALGGPEGSSHFARIAATSTGTSRKWAIAQPIENLRTNALSSGYQLSVYVRLGDASHTSMENIQVEVWEFRGITDSMDADAVEWETEGIAASPKTTNDYYQNSEVGNIVATDTWQKITITGTPTSSANNLMLMIGGFSAAHGTITSGDTVEIGAVTFVGAEDSTHFVQSPFVDELLRCQRYYTKSFPYETEPAENAGLAGAVRTMASGAGSGSNNFVFSLRWPTTMAKTPDIGGYNPSAANASARNLKDGTNTGVSVTGLTPESVILEPSTQDVLDSSDEMAIHYTANASVYD